MSQSANVNIYMIILSIIYLFIQKAVCSLESFLPSLINIRPEISMRSNSNRNVKTDLIDLKNFSYMIYPQSCGECYNSILVIVAIQSYVANFEGRKTLRETWAKPTNCIKILFFIGTTYDSNVMKGVAAESVKYHDIVQGNIEDTYRSLPYKHIMALKWIYTYCKQAKYIIKTDTDTVVRLDKLYSLLENNTWGSKGLIAGYIEKHEKVLRDLRSNMKSRIISRKEYKDEFYPPYCWGQFVIYSSDVIYRLIEESTRVPYFKIEDIYVTGILAKKIKEIRHVSLVPEWYLSRASVHNMTQYLSKKNFVYGPYSQTSEEMRETWHIIKQSEKLASNLPTESPRAYMRRFFKQYTYIR